MKQLTLLPILLLVACATGGGFKPEVKDKLCPLFTNNVVLAATDVRKHDVPRLPDLTGLDAVAAEDVLRQFAADSGIAITIKTEEWPEELQHFGTSLPVVGVWLPMNFYSRAPALRAALLRHELGHAMTHQRLGAATSALTYVALAGVRVGVETALFDDQATHYARWAGEPASWLPKYKANRSRLLWRSYVLEPFTTKKCLDSAMEAAWPERGASGNPS